MRVNDINQFQVGGGSTDDKHMRDLIRALNYIKFNHKNIVYFIHHFLVHLDIHESETA